MSPVHQDILRACSRIDNTVNPNDFSAAFSEPVLRYRSEYRVDEWDKDMVRPGKVTIGHEVWRAETQEHQQGNQKVRDLLTRVHQASEGQNRHDYRFWSYRLLRQHKVKPIWTVRANTNGVVDFKEAWQDGALHRLDLSLPIDRSLVKAVQDGPPWCNTTLSRVRSAVETVWSTGHDNTTLAEYLCRLLSSNAYTDSDVGYQVLGNFVCGIHVCPDIVFHMITGRGCNLDDGIRQGEKSCGTWVVWTDGEDQVNDELLLALETVSVRKQLVYEYVKLVTRQAELKQIMVSEFSHVELDYVPSAANTLLGSRDTSIRAVGQRLYAEHLRDRARFLQAEVNFEVSGISGTALSEPLVDLVRFYGTHPVLRECPGTNIQPFASCSTPDDYLEKYRSLLVFEVDPCCMWKCDPGAARTIMTNCINNGFKHNGPLAADTVADPSTSPRFRVFAKLSNVTAANGDQFFELLLANSGAGLTGTSDWASWTDQVKRWTYGWFEGSQSGEGKGFYWIHKACEWLEWDWEIWVNLNSGWQCLPLNPDGGHRINGPPPAVADKWCVPYVFRFIPKRMPRSTRRYLNGGAQEAVIG